MSKNRNRRPLLTAARLVIRVSEIEMTRFRKSITGFLHAPDESFEFRFMFTDNWCHLWARRLAANDWVPVDCPKFELKDWKNRTLIQWLGEHHEWVRKEIEELDD